MSGDGKLTVVRAAIATALEAVDGLNVYAEVDPAPITPFADIGWPRITYREYGAGVHGWELLVRLGVTTQSMSAATRELEDYVTRPVIAGALEADPTFAGTVHDSFLADVETGFDEESGNLTAIFNLKLAVPEDLA